MVEGTFAHHGTSYKLSFTRYRALDLAQPLLPYIIYGACKCVWCRDACATSSGCTPRTIITILCHAHDLHITHTHN